MKNIRLKKRRNKALSFFVTVALLAGFMTTAGCFNSQTYDNPLCYLYPEAPSC